MKTQTFGVEIELTGMVRFRQEFCRIDWLYVLYLRYERYDVARRAAPETSEDIGFAIHGEGRSFFVMKRTQPLVFAIELYAELRHHVRNMHLRFYFFEYVRHSSFSVSCKTIQRILIPIFRAWSISKRIPLDIFVPNTHSSAQCANSASPIAIPSLRSFGLPSSRNCVKIACGASGMHP